MKREEIKAQIEGITKEQLDWIMEEHGKDIERFKNQVTSLTGEKEVLSNQLEEVQGKLETFKGLEVTDVKQLQENVANLTKELQETKDTYAFDSALNNAIRNANAKDIDLVRAKLDLNYLKQSKDLSKDIESAISKCAKDYDFLFNGNQEANNMNVNLGAEQGNGGDSNEVDGVTKAFLEINPNIKI